MLVSILDYNQLTLPPPIPELTQVWEWNDVTGMPIFDDSHLYVNIFISP